MGGPQRENFNQVSLEVEMNTACLKKSSMYICISRKMTFKKEACIGGPLDLVQNHNSRELSGNKCYLGLGQNNIEVVSKISSAQ